jgi:hypothetical protein
MAARTWGDGRSWADPTACYDKKGFDALSESSLSSPQGPIPLPSLAYIRERCGTRRLAYLLWPESHALT